MTTNQSTANAASDEKNKEVLLVTLLQKGFTSLRRPRKESSIRRWYLARGGGARL